MACRRRTAIRCAWARSPRRWRMPRRARADRIGTADGSPGFHARLGVLDLLEDAGAVDRLAVAGERALPGRGRVGVAALLEPQIAEVILDHGAVGHLRGG